MDRKRLFVVLVIFLGMALLVGSIWSVFYFKSMGDYAKSLDNGFGGGSGGPQHTCDFVLSREVIPTQRVMSESDTQALAVSITNNDRTLTCDEVIVLDTPEFDISPITLENRHLTVPPGQKRSLIWILAPRKLGTFTIGVYFFPSNVYLMVGITVTNVFGLTIWQAQLLSYIGTFLGTFFGPVLSFTWWYTTWKKHKRKKASPSLSSIRSPTSSIRSPTGPIGKLLAKKPDVSDHLK